MIGFSVKHVIKKLQGKMHEWLQCKSRTQKNVVKNTMIGFSGKNVLKKISEKCMKTVKMCIFHFQWKKRSGIRSLPISPVLSYSTGSHIQFGRASRTYMQSKKHLDNRITSSLLTSSLVTFLHSLLVVVGQHFFVWTLWLICPHLEMSKQVAPLSLPCSRQDRPFRERF